MPDTQTDQDAVSKFLANYQAFQPIPYQAVQPLPVAPPSQPGLMVPQAPSTAPQAPNAPPAPKITAPGDTAPAIKIPKLDTSNEPYPTIGQTPEDKAAAIASAKAASVEASKPGLDTLWAREANIHNPILKALARAGTVGLHVLNAAGSAIAPEVMAQIPGTPWHHAIQVEQAEGQAADAQKRATAATAETAAQIAANNASLQPQEAEDKIQSIQSHYQNLADKADADRAQKDRTTEEHYMAAGFSKQVQPDGTTKWAFDPNSPAGKRIAEKALVDQAIIEQKDADAKYKNAQAEATREMNDPTSPKYKLALERLQVARQNAAAAGERANAYMANYQMHAHGTEADGVTPLNAATMLDGKPVGTSLAGSVKSILPKQAQMADVAIGLNHTATALKTLEDEGGSLNSPEVAAALADPETTSHQWLQGKVKSNLTPAERDAVIQVKAMNERIMAMRASAGGGVSDSQVNRLQQMLPNASTPDYDTAERQLKEVGSQLSVLSTGVPTLNRAGSSTVPSNAPKATPAKGGYTVTDPNGKVHPFDTQAQADAFKKLIGAK